jgi:hypothetical protein
MQLSVFVPVSAISNRVKKVRMSLLMSCATGSAAALVWKTSRRPCGRLSLLRVMMLLQICGSVWVESLPMPV